MKNNHKNIKKEDLQQKIDKIADEAFASHYQELAEWQRKDLSRDELFEYAEEMRKALDRIEDIAWLDLL